MYYWLYLLLSFSRKKFIKTKINKIMFAFYYVQKKRLNGLVILCIENQVLENLDPNDVIDDFIFQNARKSKLFQYLFSPFFCLLHFL